MMASSTPAPGSLPPSPALPVAAFDVSHAPADPPPPEAPVEKQTRSWQIKGPLGSYALHADRMEADFKKEQERLKGDLAKAFALKARYQWLAALIDILSEERLPEVDAEWDAVRALKMELLASQISSKKYSIESDARTLLPVWQSPLKVPESLKSHFNRLQRVLEAQKRISQDASQRLVAFQKIEQEQKILDTKLLEIEKLEKAIGLKFAALMPSTYALNEILSLQTKCSIDKLRYPHAEAPLKIIRDKFLGAEKVWKETRAVTKAIREKLQEWALVMVSVANASPNRESEVQANFQRACVQQQNLQCSRFSEPEFLEKANYLTRFGVVNPELIDWIAQAKEELEKRLKLAHCDLENLKQILANFESECREFHAQKGRFSPAPNCTPPLVEAPPSPSLLGRLAALLPGGNAKKPEIVLYEAPAPVDWSKMVEVPTRVCTSALLKSDRNGSLRPPEELRRDLTNVKEENWSQIDRWDHCVNVIWPEAMTLLNQSFAKLNGAVAKLDLQFFHLQQAYQERLGSQRPWLEALYWQLRDSSQQLFRQRAGIQGDFDRIQTELKSVIYLLDDAIKKRPNASQTGGPLDVQVINLQRTMDDAYLDLSLLSAMLQIEWEFGLKAQLIQQKLESLQASYSPEGRKAISGASPEQIARHASESQPGDSKRKRNKDRTTFAKVLEAGTVSERKALLAAMSAEGYLEENMKLQGHDRKIKEQAEQIDRLLEQLLKIFANWQHFKNMSEALAFAKPHLSDGAIKSVIMQLMVAFNQEKRDVENYVTLIPDLLNQLKVKVLWLEGKLLPDRVEWRELQERYLMRTQEGNRQRNQQIALEIAKYQLGLKAIDLFWTLGEQSCLEAIASINRLLAKKEGEGTEMISENPYLRKDKPASPALKPPSKPSAAQAKPSAAHKDWVLLADDKEEDDLILGFSGNNMFGAPPAQPQLPSPAAGSGGEVLTSSGFDRLMKQAEDIQAIAAEVTSPLPVSRLTSSLYDSKGSGGPRVQQDE